MGQPPRRTGGPRATGAGRARQPSTVVAAALLPVARVALTLEPPHLDRLFDYTVPAELAPRAVPGVRVRVRFAGRLVDGFLVQRVSTSEHPGQLAALHAVVGDVPVLTEEIRDLVRLVADRYASTFATVVRFAVPARHARAEGSVVGRLPAASPAGGAASGDPADRADNRSGSGVDTDPGSRPGQRVGPACGWAKYAGGEQWLAAIGGPALAAGVPAPRAVWTVAPGDDPYVRIAEAAAVVTAAGRGVVVVAPDGTDVARFTRAMTATGLPVEVLTADRGPQARYGAFLRLLTGQRQVAVGTRGAVFAPVRHCGLIVIWDDLDDSLLEPQAPGWHAREVAALRAAQLGASLLVAGAGCSAESANLLAAGWARPLQLPRGRLRECAPLVAASGDSDSPPGPGGSRLPGPAMAAIRDGLAAGPVLISVPRAGYRPGLACARCRQRAVCRSCARPLRQSSGADPDCPVHGSQPGWSCPTCGSRKLRATVIGVQRTAEELGRAFPGIPVIGSWADSRVAHLARPGAASLVLATPGCEPTPGPLGYSAAVLLDAHVALSRPGLRVGEEVLARWLRGASLVRPAAAGGRVVVVGDAGSREVQALIRWDPLGYASRELGERRELGLPPAARVAACTGPALAAGDFAAEVVRRVGPSAQVRVIGPLPAALPPRSGPALAPDAVGAGPETARAAGSSSPQAMTRWLLVTAIRWGGQLAASIAELQAERSARKLEPITVRIDPPQLT